MSPDPWAFQDRWVLHRDEAILVVDKPAGMPSQAADPSLPDDLVTRLREVGEPYLGVHQRLDQETSGVMVMARAREANASLSAEFEGRRVEKRYVACVEGWPRGRDRVTLRDRLTTEKDKSPKLAITHAAVRARRGPRALLDLTLETGRMHQARVQLARAGAPIAGDALYGGPPAPRLLLHARSIGLTHPFAKKRVTYAAPVPPEFDAWLEGGAEGASAYADERALDGALARAVVRRYALGRSPEHTAFRLVHEDGDALPGLAVDVYGEHLVAQFQDEIAPATREAVLDRRHALGFRGIYVKLRPRQANTLVDTRREEVAPRAPLRGEPAPEVFTVLEGGVPYRVRLGDGLSTGIFLDQRENRARVRALAGGLRVANLFAYTCAFTVAAAFGGAARTASVDASMAALEWGRKNLVEAGLLDPSTASPAHTFHAEDAFSWLARVAKREERFDLVVVDPPSYSSTRARRFVASDDYPELIAAVLAIVDRGGRVLACTNHRGISRARFRKLVLRGAERAGRAVRQAKDLAMPREFPVAQGAEPNMKSILLSVE